MNWSSKYVSVETVIAKVYRDMGMSDQINIVDAVEWAGEAIELIGAPFHLSDKTEKITIIEGRGQLPCDLHYIVTTKGKATTVQDSDCEEECESNSCNGYVAMRYSTDAYHHRYCDSSHFCNCDSSFTYKINDDFIFPSFEEGYVMINYKGIPVDDNGYPKIPDDVKFINAVAYHIMWKLAFIKLTQGKMQQGVYQKIEQDRDWYIGSAQTRANMPSVDMAESLKNNWIRLIPKINQHSDGFRSTGNPEQRFTHNSGSGRGRDNYNDDNTYFYTR